MHKQRRNWIKVINEMILFCIELPVLQLKVWRNKGFHKYDIYSERKKKAKKKKKPDLKQNTEIKV